MSITFLDNTGKKFKYITIFPSLTDFILKILTSDSYIELLVVQKVVLENCEILYTYKVLYIIQVFIAIFL